MTDSVWWFFMRHFDKEPHPIQHQFDIQVLAAQPEYAQEYVVLWELLDRDVVDVSGTGRAQARRFVAHMLHSPFVQRIQRVYASPYRRTMESARLVKDTLFPSARIMPDERLAEVGQGVRCSFSFAEVCAAFPEYVQRYTEHGFLNVAPPYGQSHAERRDGCVARFLWDLKQVNEHALVVTHAGIIDCIYQLLRGAPDEEMVHRLTNPLRTLCGSCLICRYDPNTDQVTVVAENYVPCRPAA